MADARASGSGWRLGALLGVVDRLERRIKELEHTAQSPPPATASPPGSMASAAAVRPENVDRVRTLLDKAQTLANLGQAKDAVDCFDEILVLESGHLPALLGKAKSLEKLEKLAEAVACCDQALRGDGTLTQAWLLKARLLQRVGRDKEALGCYEQALRVQDNPHAIG